MSTEQDFKTVRHWLEEYREGRVYGWDEVSTALSRVEAQVEHDVIVKNELAEAASSAEAEVERLRDDRDQWRIVAEGHEAEMQRLRAALEECNDDAPKPLLATVARLRAENADMRDGLNKYGKENERLRERGDWAVEQLRIAEAEGEHLRAHIATLEGSCPEYAKAGALQRLVVKHVAEIKRLRRENFDLKAKTHPSVVGIQEAEIERLRAELGGERCQECGHLYPDVYSVPDDEWARVTGKTDSSGLLCPSCFKLRSHSLHLLAMHKDSMRMLQESVAEIKRLKAAIEAISAHHQLGLHSDTWGPIARQALEEGK